MRRKDYMRPKTKAMDINNEQTLLAGSPTQADGIIDGDGEKFRWGGEKDTEEGGDAKLFRFMFWDK